MIKNRSSTGLNTPMNFIKKRSKSIDRIGNNSNINCDNNEHGLRIDVEKLQFSNPKLGTKCKSMDGIKIIDSEKTKCWKKFLTNL